MLPSTPKFEIVVGGFRGTFAKGCLVEGVEIIAPLYSPVKGRKRNLRKIFAQGPKRVGMPVACQAIELTGLPG
jgi:hypothetical protein